jgi:hypothetical protein
VTTYFVPAVASPLTVRTAATSPIERNARDFQKLFILCSLFPQRQTIAQYNTGQTAVQGQSWNTLQKQKLLQVVSLKGQIGFPPSEFLLEFRERLLTLGQEEFNPARPRLEDHEQP